MTLEGCSDSPGGGLQVGARRTVHPVHQDAAAAHVHRQGAGGQSDAVGQQEPAQGGLQPGLHLHHRRTEGQRGCQHPPRHVQVGPHQGRKEVDQIKEQMQRGGEGQLQTAEYRQPRPRHQGHHQSDGAAVFMLHLDQSLRRCVGDNAPSTTFCYML